MTPISAIAKSTKMLYLCLISQFFFTSPESSLSKVWESTVKECYYVQFLTINMDNPLNMQTLLKWCSNKNYSGFPFYLISNKVMLDLKLIYIVDLLTQAVSILLQFSNKLWNASRKRGIFYVSIIWKYFWIRKCMRLQDTLFKLQILSADTFF